MTVECNSSGELSLSLDNFLADLASSNLLINPPEQLDELLVTYNTTLDTLYDYHAPSRTNTILTRRCVLWFTKQRISRW